MTCLSEKCDVQDTLINYLIRNLPRVGSSQNPESGQSFRALMSCHIPDWQARQLRLAQWTASSG
jgi:hypothetical protein